MGGVEPGSRSVEKPRGGAASGGSDSAMPQLLRELAAMFRGWGAVRPSGHRRDRDGVTPGVAPSVAAEITAADLRADEVFDRVALRIHAVQRASNPVLRRFWEGSPGGGPSVWHEIPPIPVTAFREVPIVCGAPEVVFRTSGTTGGRGRRGEHHVPSLEVYRAAARGNYRQHLLGGVECVRVVSLIPDPRTVGDSSLARMAGFIADEPEVTGTTVWAFDPGTGVDVDAVRSAADGTTADGTGPVLLLTTAFALVHLLEALGPRRLPLPPGSRIMETGGFKGRVAEVDRPALYATVERVLGVAPSNVVNEYGMTELLSQAYDGVAGRCQGRPARGPAHPGGPRTIPSHPRTTTSHRRPHRFPPWVRTRALDPATLAPLPPGQPGLLSHFDLANAGSVCHILTEDFGSTTGDGGIELAGRAPGASLRGCSLVAESFLCAVGS